MKQKLKTILETIKKLDSSSPVPHKGQSRELTNIKIVDDVMVKSSLMSNAQQVVPQKEFIEASKNRIFNQLMDLQRAQSPAKAAKKRRPVYANRLAAHPVFSILLILILGFGFVGSVQAADQALPGDLLYIADTTIEEAHLLVALNDVARVRLRLDFATERLQEAQIKFASGDSRNASIALQGFEKQMEEVTIIVLNSKEAIKAELGQLVAEFHARNSSTLLALAENFSTETVEIIEHALGASEHAAITISDIPEIEALDLVMIITLKFSADDPEITKSGDINQVPTDGGQTDGGADGYLPPGMDDNPSHSDGDLPPGLEDKKVPPGQEDKEKKNN